MLEDGRLSIALLGALFGLTGAFILDIIGNWREGEKQNREMRSYLYLLASEVEQRGRFLGLGKVDKDEIWRDANSHPNINSEGPEAIERELKRTRDIFDQFPRKILSLSEDTALRAIRHYNVLADMKGLPKDRFGIRPELRSETEDFLQSLSRELDRFKPRSFFKWLVLSVWGRS